MTGGAAADRAFGSNVSTNIFETLGVRPAEGHFFSSAEEAVGQDQVIVLSDGFWRQQFGGDHSVIGRTMMLDGVSREIIGVAPPQTHFPDFETQFWIPIAFKPGDPVDPWAVFGYQAIGRLRDGIQPSQAQAELRSLHREMLTLFPWRMPDNWAAEMTVAPLLNSIVGDARPRLLPLFGAVGLVLLIACANVANLMLARAAARQREIAVRSALGADGARLVKQMLTESALLAVLSGGLGVLLAAMSLGLLKLVLPPDTPLLANLALRGEALLFAGCISPFYWLTCRPGPGTAGCPKRLAREPQAEREQCFWDRSSIQDLSPVSCGADCAGGRRDYRSRCDAAQPLPSLRHRSRIPFPADADRTDLTGSERLREQGLMHVLLRVAARPCPGPARCTVGCPGGCAAHDRL